MDYAVDAHFAAFADATLMKHASSGGNEHLIFDRAAHDMRLRSDETVAADAKRVARRAAQDCIFHDDAFASDRDGFTLRDDLGAE